MKCNRCGLEADRLRGIVNERTGRFLCQNCLGVLLRPIGCKEDDPVEVSFPNDGKVLFSVTAKK